MAENKLELSSLEYKKLQEIMSDKVLWAQVFITTWDAAQKKYTPWTARWYQAEMLRDKSPKKVARCGRRTGKCLPGWDLIDDPNTGERITIKELYERKHANFLTMDDDYELKSHSTEVIFDNGIKEVFRVTTSSGRTIDATGNHPLFTAHGWEEIDNLRIGDRVAVASAIKCWGQTDYKSKDIQELVDHLKSTSLSNTGSGIPDVVYTLTKRDTALFLAKLYASDGYVVINKNKKKYQIIYNTDLLENIKGVQHLLLKFGIDSYIKYDNKNKNYNLIIDKKKDIIPFYNRIGIYSGVDDHKKIKLLAQETADSEITFPKDIMRVVDEDRIRQGLKKSIFSTGIFDQYTTNKDINKVKLIRYGEILDNEDIINFANGDFMFEKIVSIESLGMHQTYDLTVPDTHNFVVNDFITHNTETMCVDMLYNVCTKDNYRCLVITPYENQVRLIFTRLKELLEGSPLLNRMKVRMTSNPYNITFNNNSMILGFTTGASSGSGASSVRGQKADALYLDEMDKCA